MSVVVVGKCPKLIKRVTCYHCSCILEYLPIDVKDTRRTDEGCRIMAITCPECGTEVRTNP